MPSTISENYRQNIRKCSSKFTFLDHKLIITKGSLSHHEAEIDKTPNLLNKGNLATKLQKYEFAETELAW